MKIFLVDDSSFINLVCRQALTRSGHEVVGEAYDGESAVNMILEAKPEVVVMDVALPKKNGLEATTEVLQSLPDTRIIAISALDDDWLAKKANEAGCVSFLQKPFTAKQLVSAVEAVELPQKEVKYG